MTNLRQVTTAGHSTVGTVGAPGHAPGVVHIGILQAMYTLTACLGQALVDALAVLAEVGIWAWHNFHEHGE